MMRKLTLLAAALWMLTGAVPAIAQETPPASQAAPAPPVALTAPEIISRMEARNLDRERRLTGYTVRRVYYVINFLTGRQAQQEVRMTYRAPDQKEFHEISASGSKFLRNRVFKPLMESEQDALQAAQKRRSALTHENYEFTLAGEDQLAGRHQFVLAMRPKRQEKYLLEGKLWVDSEDFAITRIEARLIRRPSFWTRKVDYVRNYRKVGEFWLPAKDESVTEILLFGRSVFRIQHEDYEITGAAHSTGNPTPANARD